MLIGSSSGIGLTFHLTRLAIALKRAGNKVVVLSDRKEQYVELPNELGSSGIKRYVSNAIDKTDIISVIRETKDVKRILKREGGFDVIHAGGVKHSVKVFFATRGLNEKPKTFATIGSLPSSRVGIGIATVSYNLFYDKCVALCNYTKGKLKNCGVDSEKIRVIPLFAPDLEWFDKAKSSEINLEDYNLLDIIKPVVFYAASHYPHKGFLYYLMAASEVLKKFDATFVLGGQGPLTTYLKNLVDKLGIGKYIVFTGWISNYHMPQILYNIADVCVSTSLVEQLPSYVMEGMASEKPIVASSVGGVPEIVIDELNGYLVPRYDFKETAYRIMNILENPKEAKDMGSAGRKMIENQLNMNTSVLNLMEVYEETAQ